MNKYITGILLNILFLFPMLSEAKKIIELKTSSEDMTLVVRKAIEESNDKDIKLVFEKGIYKFLPDYAKDKYCIITNHGNGIKKVIFHFKGLNSVEIEGNGSEFIFHGQLMPFLFEECASIKVNKLTVDWDIPFTFLGEVIAVNANEGWRDIKPFTEGFSWKLEKGRLLFPNIDGFNYSDLGSTLPFDPDKKRVTHGAWDMHSRPRWVEERENGILRFHEPLKHYPPVGSLLSSKGDREHDRYAPAFEVKNSKNIIINGVVVHHALGMGYLFERTNNIKILNSGVYLREGTPRVISSTADATHFANCKGEILIENCRIENMLDDGTNVHGTYVEVDKVVNEKTVRVALKHFEQLGFRFADVGDEVWFIHAPSPQRTTTNEIIAVNVINERFTELTFKNELPTGLKVGDILENKTWNPEFTMRGCTIRNHRARNVVLKTPLKTVIENNNFSSMMSSILFRGETFFWYESGNVEDVLIQNNTFNYCAYSGSEHAVMYITPRLGKTFNQTELYDRNIRFINNTITTFDSRIIIADRAEGLVINGNKITKNNEGTALYPDAPLFELTNCKDVQVKNNTYKGIFKKAIEADAKSKATLKVEGNKGF